MRVAMLSCFLIVCCVAAVEGQVSGDAPSVSFIDLLRALVQRRHAQRQSLSQQHTQQASQNSGTVNPLSGMLRLMAVQGLLGENMVQTLTFDCLASGQMFSDMGCMMLTMNGLEG